MVDLIEADDADVLVTLAVPGRSAVDPVWVARPDDAVRAIAVGLRALRALPVRDCPSDRGVDSRMSAAAAHGIVVPPELRTPPRVDRFVVCHGDACAPNTFVGDDGRFTATVDVGRFETADRWADLAVATMSSGWNHPQFDESIFGDAYGAVPDDDRIAFYRALQDAT